MLAVLFVGLSAHAFGATSELSDAPPQPSLAGSPRETMMTLERLATELDRLIVDYEDQRDSVTYDRLRSNIRRIVQLFDLSSVPASIRHEIGVETAAATLDILRRVDLPPSDSIPDEREGVGRWRIPGTPLVIRQMDSGPREGDFLLDARTTTVAPEFASRIRALPIRAPFKIESLSELGPQIHGPLLPASVTRALPEPLRVIWLGTPLWKTMLAVFLSVASVALLVFIQRLSRTSLLGSDRLTRSVLALGGPIGALLVLRVLQYLIRYEINVQGGIARVVDLSISVSLFIAASWLVWVVASLFVELIIKTPRIADQSIDANLLRLSARVLAIAAVIVIWLRSAEDILGIPIAGVLTGLGIGGLAVALAVRPTLENLIGGFILYTDKPIRVGDFCGFGEREGTIEKIGARSTLIRGLDRTLTSVPNAQFVDMQLTNWASCDRMLILTTLGLRYETQPDQLRWVLAKLREMCHAHPKIDRNTVRIRFVGYGASSLDIQFRVYALTREWNEFFAIREDVFLRVNEIVAQSGTGFAFPSQTLYFGKDSGLDANRSSAAAAETARWRRSRQLPFPTFSESRIEEVAGTLDYPPRGSMSRPDGDEAPVVAEEALERLSAPDPEEGDAQATPPESRENGSRSS